MQFKAQEDIEAPIDYVYERLTDFDHFERQALRRGARIQKLPVGKVGQGPAWEATFDFRGKQRRLVIEVVEQAVPEHLALVTDGSGLHGETEIDLVRLSANSTRVIVFSKVSAKNLASRLVLQSLKLARGSLMQRIKKRIGVMARDIETQYREVP